MKMKPTIYILTNVNTTEVVAFTANCAPFAISPLSIEGQVFDWLGGKWRLDEVLNDKGGQYVAD